MGAVEASACGGEEGCGLEADGTLHVSTHPCIGDGVDELPCGGLDEIGRSDVGRSGVWKVRWVFDAQLMHSRSRELLSRGTALYRTRSASACAMARRHGR